MSFISDKIQNKIIALLLLLVLGVTGFFVLWLIPQTQKYIQQETIESQIGLASAYARDVSTYLDGVVQDLSVISRSVFGTSRYKLQDEYLRQFMQANPVYVEISHYNQSNVRQAYMSRFSGTSPLAPSDISRIKSITSDKGKWLSEVNRPEKGYPTIKIAVPVIENEQVNGFLMAEVNLLGISQILHSAIAGKTGSICIIGPNGEFIAHNDPDLVNASQSPSGMKAFPPIHQMIGNNTGGGEYSDGVQPILGSFAVIKDLNWVVLVQQSLQEAYDVPNNLKSMMLRGIVLVALIMTVLGILFANRLVRPIRLLAQAMQRVKKNEFNFEIKKTTNDEIGQLTMNFMHMKDAVKDAKEKLEQTNRGLDAEVKRQTAELAKAFRIQQQLEKEAEIGNLVSTISHDIRNPINNIMSHLEILQMKNLISKTDSNVIIEILKDITLFVDDILDYGKTRKAEFKPCRVETILDDAIKLCAYKIGHHKVVKEIGPDHPEIMVDGRNAVRIFQNLLNNALEAMLDPGVVTLRAYYGASNNVIIEVEDTGQGIEESMLAMLFKEKITSKNNGNGLGMSVIGKYVKIHNGSIKVDSIVGKGTKFTVTLPINPADVQVRSAEGGKNVSV